MKKEIVILCYRDMTFCSSNCVNTQCPRHFGPQEQEAADKWWGVPGAPVAFSDFTTDKGCPIYVAPSSEVRREGQDPQG